MARRFRRRLKSRFEKNPPGKSAQTFIGHLMKIFSKIAFLACFAMLSFSNLCRAETNFNKAINIDVSQTFKWNARSIDALATNAAHVMKRNCSANCTLTLRVFVTRPISRVGLKRIDRLHREILRKVGGLHGGTVRIVDSIHLI